MGERQRGPRRGLIRRLLEVRGLVGAPVAASTRVSFTTGDGVTVHARHLPRRGAAGVIIAHGFAAHGRKPAYARLADGLSVRFGVLALDLRGHGRSGGRCSFGADEVEDLLAAVAWMRAEGYRVVAAVGVSMGATAVLHAAARGAPLGAIAVVSAPAFVGRTDSRPLALLDWVWRSRARRWGLRALTGVRMVSPAELHGLDHPVELAAHVDAPLLVVHGVDDHFFPPSDAAALAASARGEATVWLEGPGFGHAEDGLSRRFARRLGRALETALDRGRFPGRPVDR